MRRIAVIGAGMAGLAVCWHLSRYPGIQAVLFDPKGIGGGASGISTGLLHPFPGRLAHRSWRALDGMRETEHLIGIAEQAAGRPVAEKTGIFRPAITEQQKRDFPKCDAEFIHHPRFGSGLWIPYGITLYSRLYLQGLWKACAASGAEWVGEAVGSLDALGSFDRIILTAGFETLQFDACKELPLKTTKGQTLICRWPERLPFSLASQGHITPTEDPALCQIGSTYEEHYETLEPDPSVALALKEKAAQFYPPARDFEVVEIRSGVRIARPKGYRPIAARIDSKTWVFTGLGSRGMLYHAWLGKALAEAVVKDWTSLEPKEVFESVSVNSSSSIFS